VLPHQVDQPVRRVSCHGSNIRTGYDSFAVPGRPTGQWPTRQRSVVQEAAGQRAPVSRAVALEKLVAMSVVVPR
jgi:hypothetical protein